MTTATVRGPIRLASLTAAALLECLSADRTRDSGGGVGAALGSADYSEILGGRRVQEAGYQMISDAEELRFKTFLSTTSAEARDWIAYLEFEEAIREASQSAAMVNISDAGPEGGRERNALEIAFSDMFFRLYPNFPTNEMR